VASKEPSVTGAEVVAYLAHEQLDRAARRYLAPQVEALRRALLPDETPILLTEAYQEDFGLLALTDQRLVFLCAGCPSLLVPLPEDDAATADAIPDDSGTWGLRVTVAGADYLFEAVSSGPCAARFVALVSGKSEIDATVALICPACEAEQPHAANSQRFTCPYCGVVTASEVEAAVTLEGTRPHGHQPSPKERNGEGLRLFNAAVMIGAGVVVLIVATSTGSGTKLVLAGLGMVGYGVYIGLSKDSYRVPVWAYAVVLFGLVVAFGGR
jgi:hypothetical protein